MKKITYQGLTLSIPEWSRRLGIPASTIRTRLGRLGMSVNEALSRPPDTRFRSIPRPSLPAPRPAPRLQRDARGLAVVRWSEYGRQHKRSFGQFGTEEAIAAYTRWAAEWVASRGHAPRQGPVCVAEIVLRYLEHAEATYRKHGRETSEVAGIRSALAVVNDLYGDTDAREFAPPKLQACVSRWVESGNCAKTVNDKLGRVCRAFSWAVGQGLIPSAVADALRHVPTIRPGRTGHREPVRAAPDADIDAAIPHLHTVADRQATLEAILRLQRVTGMRPGEVLELRAEDIDRTRTPWEYRPESGGKTLHLERLRKIYLGPLARGILAPWLLRSEPGQPVFTLHGQRGVVPVRIEFLRRCLADACRIAGVPVIRPNQIRHTRATEVHRRYEDDSATAAALGNSPEVARQIYVDGPGDAVARRIAEEIG